MKVSELIEILKEFDENETVKIWNEFGDIDIKNIRESDVDDNTILLS